MKLLARRGVPVEDMGRTYRAESDAVEDEARTLRPLQSGGGQAGDRGATQAAVAEGRFSWPAVERSTPFKGGGTIGRTSS